jgi:hypothetical protein
MTDSFLKWCAGLQTPAQLRNLLRIQCPGGKLFERAKGDAVGLAQGAIDGASFGHAHLGVVQDERRDIAGMSVAVTDKATAFRCLIDGSFKHPEAFLRSTQREHWFSGNPLAVVFCGKAQ